MRDPGLRSQHRAELQVGILVLVSIVALFAGIIWITGLHLGGNVLKVFATAPDAAQVTGGTRVYLHGVDVGSVKDVRLVDGEAAMRLEITFDGTLPRDTRAIIKPSGFLGSQMIDLLPGQAERQLRDGDTIRAMPTQGLQGMAGDLGDQATRVLEQTRSLLSDAMISDVHSSTQSLASSMHELQQLVESERQSLADMIEHLDHTSDRLSSLTSGPELQSTLTHLDSLTLRLSSTSQELESSSRSLSSIMEKVDHGEGSLGLLVNDDQLYQKVTAAAANLQSASEEIALLTKDIRERPERYLKISVF